MTQENGANSGAKLTAGQKRLATKMREEHPGVQVFQPKTDMGKYYGPILFANKEHVVQQVSEGKAVAHSRKEFGELAAADIKKGKIAQIDYAGGTPTLSAADPARWLERTHRTVASPELLAVAQQVNQNVQVFIPPNKDLTLAGFSAKYDGPVIAVTDDKVIQSTGRNMAYAHAKADLDRATVGVGEALSVTYAAGKVQVQDLAPPTRAPRQEKADPAKQLSPEDEKKKDFYFGRSILMKQYGQNLKEGERLRVYDASIVMQKAHPDLGVGSEKGEFGGRVVVATNQHVFQRIHDQHGNPSFIVHDRAKIDGEIKRGELLKLSYDKGRATPAPIELKRDRQQGVER